MIKCKANQCPLEAEFVTNWETVNNRQVPKWGVCRYHRHAPPGDWGAVTRRVQMYESRIRSMHIRGSETDPLFMPYPGEQYGVWADRYEGNLRRIILAGDVSKVDADANFAEIIHLLGGAR